MQNLKTILANLSHHPGVYQMIGEEGEVLYVGKAKDLKKRVSSYFSNKAHDQKTATLVQYIHNIEVTITSNESEAVLLECNLIKKHHPRYNVLLRDDKSYPYILISDHKYPRIDIFRGRVRKHGSYFGPFPSAYAVRDSISLLQKIFRIRTCRDGYFNARTRPCLLYQIERCTGPCVDLISKDDYNKSVQYASMFLQGKSLEVIERLQDQMEASSKKLNFEAASQFRDQIKRLRQLQDKQHVSMKEGDADIIGFAFQSGVICIQLLAIRHGEVLGSNAYFPKVPAYSTEDEIISAFISQHYLSDPSHVESIPKQIITESTLQDKTMLEAVLTQLANRKVEVLKPMRGEKKKWLQMASSNAKQALALHVFSKTNIEERVGALQKVLKLTKPPARIECFDISHSSGEAAVASCVVFDQSGAVKSDYRKFNIKNIQAGDDVAAMRQVISRRFKRIQKENASLPDIVLIDGGQHQLNAAMEALQEINIQEILLVGVSKGAGRKPGYESLHIMNQPSIHLPADSHALHFIQQIRDEAHRFAITGHRHRRDKARRQSSLEFISGIGAKRRRDLLRYFGGIQGISRASLDELTKVPGISYSLAERIFAALHDANL